LAFCDRHYNFIVDLHRRHASGDKESELPFSTISVAAVFEFHCCSPVCITQRYTKRSAAGACIAVKYNPKGSRLSGTIDSEVSPVMFIFRALLQVSNDALKPGFQTRVQGLHTPSAPPV
jgi:hypothetical protein